MIEVGGFALLRPLWLAGVPLAFLIGFLIVRRVTALAGWDRAVDPTLLAALDALGRVVPGTGRRNRLPLIAAALIVVALAGPARESKDGTTFRNLDGVVIVMDLSRSVATGESLNEAVTAARLVAERAGSRPVALVVYAGDAYLASGFTTDAAALGTTIAVLDGETVPEAGSRPERGLALARTVLAEAAIVAGEVVLVTDGGGIGRTAMREAEAITAAGGRVSTLFVPASGGSAGTEPPQRSVVDAVARIGGGTAADVGDPMPVADAVGARWPSRLVRGDFAVLIFTDYGRYLIGLALIPALLLFRRRA
jgi:Ca-activated chloride channel homolog